MSHFFNRANNKKYIGFRVGDLILCHQYNYQEEPLTFFTHHSAIENDFKVLFYESESDLLSDNEKSQKYIDFFFKEFEGEKKYSDDVVLSANYYNAQSNFFVYEIIVKYQNEELIKQILIFPTKERNIFYEISKTSASAADEYRLSEQKDFIFLLLLVDNWVGNRSWAEDFRIFRKVENLLSPTQIAPLIMEKSIPISIDTKKYSSFIEEVINQSWDLENFLSILHQEKLFFFGEKSLLQRFFLKIQGIFFSFLLLGGSTSAEKELRISLYDPETTIFISLEKKFHLPSERGCLFFDKNSKTLRSEKKFSFSMDLNPFIHQLLSERENSLLESTSSLYQRGSYHDFIFRKILIKR